MTLSAVNSTVPSATGQTGGVETTTASNTTIDSADFLNLLCLQLEYQDPLEPMDTSQMTSELCSLSLLEQAELTNAYLSDISLSNASVNNSQALDCIGKTVGVPANSFSVVDGEAEDLNFFLAEDAEQVFVSIYDAEGQSVDTLEMETAASGAQTIEWDATDDLGEPQPDGAYTYDVAAYDSSGDPLDATPFVESEVTGVYFHNGSAVLETEKGKIDFDDVTMVFQA